MTRFDWQVFIAYLALAAFAVFVWFQLIRWQGWGVVPLVLGVALVAAAFSVAPKSNARS